MSNVAIFCAYHAADKNTDFLTEFLPWSKSLPEHIRKSKKAGEK